MRISRSIFCIFSRYSLVPLFWSSKLLRRVQGGKLGRQIGYSIVYSARYQNMRSWRSREDNCRYIGRYDGKMPLLHK